MPKQQLSFRVTGLRLYFSFCEGAHHLRQSLRSTSRKLLKALALAKRINMQPPLPAWCSDVGLKMLKELEGVSDAFQIITLKPALA